MSTRKTKVKSSSTRRKANAKLGYGETNKNVNTLRKIEKANADEKEAGMEELLGISKKIKSLEKQRKTIITSVMEDARKNLSEWAAKLPAEEFGLAMQNMFVESSKRRGGTNYFTWNETESIQRDFENYVKQALTDKDSKKFRYFYYKPYQRLFNLKTFKMLCTSRSSMVTEKYDIDDKGNLVYDYSGTAYHGFGSVDNSVQQQLVLNLQDLSVVHYTDSTDKYFQRSTGGHSLDTEFIKKLVGSKSDIEQTDNFKQ